MYDCPECGSPDVDVYGRSWDCPECGEDGDRCPECGDLVGFGETSFTGVCILCERLREDSEPVDPLLWEETELEYDEDLNDWEDLKLWETTVGDGLV